MKWDFEGNSLSASIGTNWFSTQVQVRHVWDFENGDLNDNTGTLPFTVVSGNAFSLQPVPYSGPTQQISFWDFEGSNMANSFGSMPFTVVNDGGTAFTNPVLYSKATETNSLAPGLKFLSTYHNSSGSQIGDGPKGKIQTAPFTLAANAAFEFDWAGAGGSFEIVEAGTVGAKLRACSTIR